MTTTQSMPNGQYDYSQLQNKLVHAQCPASYDESTSLKTVILIIFMHNNIIASTIY